MNINFKEVIKPVVKITTPVIMKLRKDSPHILIGAGIVGMVGATVLASKATLGIKAIFEDSSEYKKLIDEEHDKEAPDYDKKAYAKDLMYLYVRTSGKVLHLYGPAIAVGTVSIAAILTSHGILIKRNAAIVAAYNTLDQMYSKYRKETRLTLGDEKEREIFERAHQEDPVETYSDDGQVVDEPRNPYEDVSGYAKWFDEGSPYWQRDAQYNRTFLMTQQNYMNDLLHTQGHVFLNDVYDALGLQRTRAGAVVGWKLGNGDGYIDFGIFDKDRENARNFVNGFDKSVLLDFNVDGLIWDLI